MTTSFFAKYISSVRWLFPTLLVVVSLLVPMRTAISHEHSANEDPERARVVEWLRTWKRPYGGPQHRTMSCCYIDGLHQDCFAVKETRFVDGHYEVFPDVEGHLEYARWYTVPHNIEEANQPDPRESPDSRSYVCIAGQTVICFVAGAGF